VVLDELKANFIAVASHELRTPAAAVYGALQTIVGRGDALATEIREELLQTAYEQSDRMRRLLEQLLDLSRLDSRAMRVDPKPIVLQSTLQKIAAEVVPKGAPVSIDVPEDLAVVVDPLVLDRVIANVLGNAVRYGRPPVVVSAEAEDRHLRIAVDDSGSGVPPELEPRLFDRFVRQENGLGSGLGLAIARAYARAHGGDLFYERRKTGGARFELLLPLR
jgi:signal transduction histidine kinase